MTRQVLLVHGGHTGAWSWEAVIAELTQLGVTAKAVDLTTRHPGGTLAGDELLVREALAAFGGPTVLVGHSYSGAVITAASAGNDDVAHLVYVAAALPQAGQSVASSLRDELQEPLPSPSDAADGWAPIDLERARTVIYNDASEEQFATVFRRLGGFATRALTEIPTGIGWTDHPSTYLVCTMDATFPVPVQRRFASHLTHSVDIEAGHAPMLTRPAEVAAAIAGI